MHYSSINHTIPYQRIPKDIKIYQYVQRNTKKKSSSSWQRDHSFKDNYYDQYINELDNSNNYQEFNRKLLYERGRYMALLRKNNIDYSSVKKKYLKYHEKHLNSLDS